MDKIKKTMKFVELMRQRYTTKSYDASKRIETEKIEELLESLRLAPSSINSQPWGFTVVSDQALKERLAEHSLFNADKVRDCSHLVVLSVYRDVATFEAERLHDMEPRAVEYYQRQKAIVGEQAIASWLEKQVYIALGVLLTGAAYEGIDSTPMEGVDTEAYGKVLGLDKYRPLLVVPLGIRTTDDSNQPQITPKNRRSDVLL